MYVRNPLPKGVEGVRKKESPRGKIEGGSKAPMVATDGGTRKGYKRHENNGQLEVQEVVKRLCTGNVHGWFTTTHHSSFLDTENRKVRSKRLAPHAHASSCLPGLLYIVLA
jgi:hypothetical protein